jgi:hypothetical protein
VTHRNLRLDFRRGSRLRARLDSRLDRRLHVPDDRRGSILLHRRLLGMDWLACRRLGRSVEITPWTPAAQVRAGNHAPLLRSTHRRAESDARNPHGGRAVTAALVRQIGPRDDRRER